MPSPRLAIIMYNIEKMRYNGIESFFVYCLIVCRQLRSVIFIIILYCCTTHLMFSKRRGENDDVEGLRFIIRHIINNNNNVICYIVTERTRF